MTHAEENERDALFAAWSEDRQGRAPRSLQEWIELHPAYAADLIRWAAEAPLLDCALDLPPDAAGEARVLAIGRQVLAEMRARYQTAAVTPLQGLLEAARSRGLTPKALAGRLNVGLSTVAKLQQRHFRLASIPSELIACLADALQVSADQVRDYLRRPPTLAPAASYKSE